MIIYCIFVAIWVRFSRLSLDVCWIFFKNIYTSSESVNTYLLALWNELLAVNINTKSIRTGSIADYKYGDTGFE